MVNTNLLSKLQQERQSILKSGEGSSLCQMLSTYDDIFIDEMDKVNFKGISDTKLKLMISDIVKYVCYKAGICPNRDIVYSEFKVPYIVNKVQAFGRVYDTKEWQFDRMDLGFVRDYLGNLQQQI